MGAKKITCPEMCEHFLEIFLEVVDKPEDIYNMSPTGEPFEMFTLYCDAKMKNGYTCFVDKDGKITWKQIKRRVNEDSKVN